MDLILAKARWILGFIADSQLPNEVGVRALEAGIDSESLHILAISDDAQEARRLFLEVSEELRLPDMSRTDAARVYAKAICKDIVAGKLKPIDGAKKLWHAANKVDDPDFHDLDPFIYSASELESRPEDADFFDHKIVEEAREWID